MDQQDVDEGAPINININNTITDNTIITDPIRNHAQMIYDRYPTDRRGSLSQITTALQQAQISEMDYPLMLQQLDTWIESYDWQDDNGTYVLGAAKWIRTGRWRSTPKRPKIPARRELSPDELWTIDQMMTED